MSLCHEIVNVTSIKFTTCRNVASFTFFYATVPCYRLQGKVKFSQASVILSTIGRMATRSLLILVTLRSVRILLECFLWIFLFWKNNIFLFPYFCSPFSCISHSNQCMIHYKLPRNTSIGTRTYKNANRRKFAGTYFV